MLQTATATRSSRMPAAPAQTADGLALVEAQGSNLRLEPDRMLFQEGDAADYCYKIISGAVRLLKQMPDGRRHVTNFFLPGSLIGFDLETEHGFAAEAIVETVVRRYPKPSLVRIADESPRLLQQMLSLTLRRLASAQQQALSLGCRTAMERLAGFIAAQADRLAEERRPDTQVNLPMSRLDIADYLGLTVETVSRLFTKLRRDGVIALPTAQRVVIRDWDALDELCEGAV
jgi:CRP/FNR family transcriptional regulator